MSIAEYPISALDENTSDSDRRRRAEAWVREPLLIAISMVVTLAILLPALAGHAELVVIGAVQLALLVKAVRIDDPRNETFRLVMHTSQAFVFSGTAYAVFHIGYPGSIILYYGPPALLCLAHLLGARATLAWLFPWLALIVGSEFADTPNTIDPTGFESIFVETIVLATGAAFAISMRRAYDQKSAELERLAVTDALTGLLNRRELERQLESAIDRARRFERRGAILFIDIDGLKQINDRHGHQAGDAMICTIAERLRENVRSIDLAARFGGDEFVVLISEFEDARAAEIFADKLLRIFSRTVAVGGQAIRPRVSIGLAEFPTLEADTEALLGQADRAMYAAKQAGGNRSFHATHAGPKPASAPAGSSEHA